MRKPTTLFLLIFWVLSSQAQEINLKNIQQLPLSKESYFPLFARNANEIFITGPNHKGLSAYNIDTHKEILISEEHGAGYRPQLNSSDEVVYSTSTIHKGRKHLKHYSYSFSSKESKLIEKPSDKPMVKVDGKQIKLHVNGVENALTPLGDVYYIWASLSADKTKLLFTAITKGTYVTDLKGNILADLGYLNAPVWGGNNWVIGMNDIDNHDQVIKSTLEAVHIQTKKRVVLTNPQENIAMYPKVSQNNSKLVFHNTKGEVFIADLKMEE